MSVANPNDRLPLAVPPRDRFVRAIAERVIPERITEVHLFQPIRQGGVETGVAVIAVERTSEAEGDAGVLSPDVVKHSDAADFLADEEGPDIDSDEDAMSLAEDFAEPDEGEPDRTPHRGERHSVLTAWYRLTLKGAERGKWEFNLADEAIAPLETIVAVARGVGQRAGDADDPERWTGEHFRNALSEASAG